jgi:stage II sporulation protein D
MLTHPPQEETNDHRLLYSFARHTCRGIVVCLLLLASSCASHETPNSPVPHTERRQPSQDLRANEPHGGGDDTRIAVQVEGGRIERLALDDYVRGTVAAEMWVPATEDPAVAERIFEVQALVARTYALANLGRHAREGFDLCSEVHCQLFRTQRVGATSSRWAEAIATAVTRTHGQVILFDGAPILALFHANCGGATSAAQTIWGGTTRPYLVSVVDGEQCARAPGATWRTPLARDALTRALDADPRTAVHGRLDSIDIVQADAAGRASLVALTGASSPVIRGEELRLILVRAFGPRSVRSPRFTVQRDGDQFVFGGTGIGHGAGLCQFGAMTRLRAGVSPADVIGFYYPGTSVSRWRGPRTT